MPASRLVENAPGVDCALCDHSLLHPASHLGGEGLRVAGASYLTVGDIASDLYGPQFWDDNFQFSFSVVVSCKSNKQLGYF